MICAGCGHENPERAKFCLECGAAVVARCARCATELPPAAKFCLECGAPTATRAVESAGRRKVVTIVFADLVGSTALHERLDAESARRFMEGYYRAMRGAVEAHGGTVTQLLGDGVKAVFGIPRVAEDDAIRAVRAAVAMQRAFRELAEQQSGRVGTTGLRVAVNTGEVVANDEAEIIGDPVNVAARLQEQGRDGDVVVGESTHRLVAALVTLELLGSFALKGRTEAVRAYRVESLERPAGTAAVAFVGRDEELARITAVYEKAIEKPAACLAVLLGSPGLGKSRIIEEFVCRRGDEAAVLSAHCDAAGGASFAPLAEALRESLGIDVGASGEALRASVEAALPGSDADRARIVVGITALLAGSPASPEETFFVVRRLLASFAALKPVVLVIDDLHWAEPLLLDLVEHLVQWGSGMPLLVLVSARPELRDVRSSLATPGGLVADVMTLAGLDAGATMRLAANVIGAADLPAAVAVKVLAASEGNPLFVGELVRMLVHEGALKKVGDRWTTGTALAALEMPPTIQALLAARIERLRPEERSVLERAAVVGRFFSRSSVAELLPRDVTDLDARLESLRRSELIERDTGWFLGEPVLRFHHVLIRDAAYRRVLKETRADLHARLADWIEARTGEATEQDETIGWHLEQAHQHLRELGPIDEQGRSLGERAARRLAAAGRRALARDDLPLAASLLGRALDRLDPADSGRADLALDWCEALLAGGDVAPAAAAIDELGRFTADSPRLRAWHTCFAGQLRVLTAPAGLHETADAVAAAATELTSLGDAAGEAKAHFVYALALARLGKVGACEAALDRALAAARRADDRRRANTVLAIAPLAALWGPSPVTRASGRCLDVVRVLRITQSAPAVEAVALSCQGVLEALRGRTDAARRMIASSRAMVEELGITQRLLEADVFAGQVELLEGDAAAAERRLRPAFDGLRELGLGIDAARAGALLARALLALGQASEAEALSHESEALAGDDLKAAIAWRGVRAEALARRGQHEAAVELASQAVEIAAATDALLDHADARLALAAALRAAGRGREADAEERRAIELWEAKGATLLVERARSEVARVEPVASTPATSAEPARPARRRVRANAATTSNKRFIEAVGARDADAIAALVAPDVEHFHHPTATAYGREGALTLIGQLIRARDLEFRGEAIATLGESLALIHESTSFSDLDDDALGPFGAVERERFGVLEVDASGRQRRVEFFAPDHLGNAVARLYQRHAELLPEGSARDRAMTTARAVAHMLTTSVEPDRAALFSPSFEAVDHRLVGYGSTGAEGILRGQAAWRELADELRFRIDDVLGLSVDAVLRRTTAHGTSRASGGAFERTVFALTVFDCDGRVARAETFGPDKEADALARFDELTAELAAPRFANAAWRFVERSQSLRRERDWDGFRACLAPSCVMDDRRPHVQLQLSVEQVLASERILAESPGIELHPTLLATRGERLALLHLAAAGEAADGGAVEVFHLCVLEVDADALAQAIVLLEADDLDAAYAELDARYDAVEASAHPRMIAAIRARNRAWATRDWEAFEALYPPDFVMHDHGLLGFGEIRGAKAYAQLLQSLVDLAPDARFRQDHVRRTQRGQLEQTKRLGTRDGGAFEKPTIYVHELDERGKFSRLDGYDPEQLDQALARFDELRSAASPSVPFANAATRAWEKQIAAWLARAWERSAELTPERFRYVDRRRMFLLDLDRTQYLEFIRSLGDLGSTRLDPQILGTRGDRLALCRERVTVGGADVGPSEIESLFLTEANERGEVDRFVRFDADDGDAAYAELDARFAAGEAAIHPRASAWVAEFRRAFAARDWDAMSALCTPDQLGRNHRLVGWGTLRGPAAYVPVLPALVELAPDTRLRIDHLRTSEFGHLWTSVWQGTREGGAYETPWIQVVELDERGLEIRLDVYDIEMLDAARARFDEIRARTAPKAVGLFANAATGAWLKRNAAWVTRDWQRFSELTSLEARFLDRRRLFLLDLDREQYFEFARSLGDMSSTRVNPQILATRGDRLALGLNWVAASDADTGPSESEFLEVVESDDVGCIAACVRFDADDLDAAYAELDARFEAGQGALHARVLAARRALGRGWARRDWEAVAALFAPDFVYQDHRLLGFGTSVRDPAEWIRAQQALVELAPDVRARGHHVRQSESGYLYELSQVGTREGGAFELRSLAVIELDERGQICSLDTYDVASFVEARARFDEIVARTASPAVVRFANAASRVWDQLLAAFLARDWKRYRELMSIGFRYVDRKKGLARLELDRDQRLEYIRSLGEMSSVRAASRLLATRGERLALGHLRVEVAGGDVGPSEIESLILTETNESGEVDLHVRFDADDVDAAYAELDARYDAGEAALHAHVSAATRAIHRAWAQRDWNAVAALLAPDFVPQDHRLLGFGTTMRDQAEWIRALQLLADLAPDARPRLHHVRLSDRGYLCELTIYGTREGGAFEIPQIAVREIDSLGRMKRQDIFDPDQLDQARARFDEIGSQAAPDPLRIPPNAATRAWERLDSYAAAGDWEALSTLCAPIVWEDRRPLLRTTGDCKVFVASCRHIREIGAHPLRSPLASLGERLALQHGLWRMTEDGQVSEVEAVELIEVDAGGRVTAMVVFGPEDRAAASTELFERYVRSGGDGMPAARIEFLRSWNDHDLDRMRAVLPADYFFLDHRRTGIGRVEGLDAYLASLDALFELSRDVRLDPLYLVAAAPHGRVDVLHWLGTNTEGGEFEAIFVALSLYRGERHIGVEQFELDDLDAALARFEELRPDPLRIPSNAATRANDRAAQALEAGDRDALRALASRGFRFEDRGKRALVSGDVEVWIDSALFLASEHLARLEPELIGTLGDRIALHRDVWTGAPEGWQFELGGIRVTQLDAEGKLHALTLFDADDRGESFAEALERFALGEAAAGEGSMAFAAFFRAFSQHDWDAARRAVAPDFVFDDHRTLGMGTLDRELWIASMRAQAELGSGLSADVIRILAWNRHGLVATFRTHGTVRDGGPFEHVFVGVSLSAGGRVRRYLTFDLAEEERALARFEALCTERAASA